MNFYFAARGIVSALSHIFFPVKVYGDAGVMPDEGGLIVCSNHISYLDVVFLGMIFKRQIHFVAKDKYAKKPVLKTLIKWLGGFGINTEQPDIKAIKTCISVPKNGDVLGIFPEGTRILHGKVSTPMPGTMMIANKSNAPILYCRIKPKYGVFRLFARTDVYIGNIVDLKYLGVESGKGLEYKQAADKLCKMIYSLGE